MIDENKKYKFRNGEDPHLIIFDVPHKYQILSIDMEGTARRHDSDGKSIHGNPLVDDDFDLVEIIPYEDIKIGDAVVVRGKEYGTEIRNHIRVFAGVNEDGLPETFDIFANGEFVRFVWDNCRKATEDDFE